MTGIPPLVLEEARKMKDLDFERLIIFNHDCTCVLNSIDGHATGVPMSATERSQAYKKPTLHNHPFLNTENDGLCTSAIPSIGDVLGAVHYVSPALYVCDKEKITRTIPPKLLNEDERKILQNVNFFGLPFSQCPNETVKEILDVLSDIKLDFQLFDINTLELRNDFMTREDEPLEL